MSKAATVGLKVNMQTELSKKIIVECETSPVVQLLSWHDVDWKQVNQNVTNLRARIFACKRNGKLRQLRNLQRLMLSSSANLLLSIRKVGQSKGRKTAGMDGVTLLRPADRLKLFHTLSRIDLNNYAPRASRRIHLIKPDGSPRPIGIPTIKDRILQNVVKNALEPEWEAVFHGYSYGFRPGRTINDAVGRVRSILIPKRKTWILEVDTAKCFDSLSHPHMLEQIKHFPARNLIGRWLTAGILLDGVWLQTLTGTPQGGVISPLLCNIAMHGLGPEIGIKSNKDGRTRSDSPYSIVIYADDMVIFASTKEGCLEAKQKLEGALSSRGLKLNETKTVISNAFTGFDFLGFHFSIKPRFGRETTTNWVADSNRISLTSPKSWTVPLAEPSHKSLTKVKEALKLVFLSHKGGNCDKLIQRINWIIRGWSNSKRFWYVWPHFKRLDFYLWNLQQKWIQRMHRNKGRYWVNSKYYSLQKQPELGYRDKWTFRSPTSGRPMLKFYWFYQAGHSGKDWVQIASDMCPDDRSFLARKYFEKRALDLFERKLIDLTANRDRAIAQRQLLLCPICGDSLFNGEPIHRHHIIERSQGGSDSITNLCLVHLPCHHRVHYGGNRDVMNKRLLAAGNQIPAGTQY
jgi:RNA-directed DNA polymerase